MVPTLEKLLQISTQIEVALKALSDVDLQLKMNSISSAPYMDYRSLDYDSLRMFQENVGMHIRLMKETDRADSLARAAKEKPA